MKRKEIKVWLSLNDVPRLYLDCIDFYNEEYKSNVEAIIYYPSSYDSEEWDQVVNTVRVEEMTGRVADYNHDHHEGPEGSGVLRVFYGKTR